MSERAEEPGAARRLHAKSFKLRFGSQRELGRSDVSAVKPLRLPAVVCAKWYRREPESEVPARLAERALRRVRAMFGAGPRERLAAPQTTSHEYGWWQRAGGEPHLQHRIRDSAWLKERLRVLAADSGLRRR